MAHILHDEVVVFHFDSRLRAHCNFDFEDAPVYHVFAHSCTSYNVDRNDDCREDLSLQLCTCPSRYHEIPEDRKHLRSH